jgi:hypothetical protein
LLPFPVFVNGGDYNGQPDPLRTPLLLEQINRHFVPMVAQLPTAIFVPLGKVPTLVLRHLVERQVVSGDRVSDGLPHPSGANAERIKYFLGDKARDLLSVKTDAVALDAARVRLCQRVLLMNA